jgi:acyl CoA:acetate/3-ketoacid CoA transferase alpha subunit
VTVQGLCGIPENLIQALLDGGKKELTIVSNNAGEKRRKSSNRLEPLQILLIYFRR